MLNPLFTTATPGGLLYTIVTFSTTLDQATSAIPDVTVALSLSTNTSLYHQTGVGPTGVSNVGEPAIAVADTTARNALGIASPKVGLRTYTETLVGGIPEGIVWLFTANNVVYTTNDRDDLVATNPTQHIGLLVYTYDTEQTWVWTSASTWVATDTWVAFVPYTPDVRMVSSGTQWTQVTVPLVGDSAQIFTDLAQHHMDALTTMGRTSQVTATSLFTWLSDLWLTVKTYFIVSRARRTPFSMSFFCPESAPAGLVVPIPELFTPDNAAMIPDLQAHLPSVSFSDLTYDTNQAYAGILYPTPGQEVTVGIPFILMADMQQQTEASHKFTWYFGGSPALTGAQVQTRLGTPANATDNTAITLLVTNLQTGVSSVALTYVTVVN